MQLRIVLIYSFIFANTSVSAQASARDEKMYRKEVTVSEPSIKGDILTPLNVKSSNVPVFSAFDHQFTTSYRMTCGSKVDAIVGVKGSARCMPEYNDIVVVENDDDVLVEDCLKIIICTPSKDDDNVLCQPKSIKVVLPHSDTLLTHNAKEETGTSRFKVSKGDIVFTNDPKCMMTFSKEQKLRHRFQNKGNKLRAILAGYPGFYLQPTFYSERQKYRRGNTVTFGGALHKGTRSLSRISCNAECDEGQLFYYKMPANLLIYSKFFVEGAVCDWIKICTAGSNGVSKKNYMCDDVDLVNIYVRNGFVVMPGTTNAAPIRFIKSTAGTTPSDVSSRPTQIAFEYDGDRGENNGVVHQVHVDIPIKGVNTGKKTYITYQTARSRTRPPTLATAAPTPNFSAVAPVTTTRFMGVGVFARDFGGGALIKGRKGWLIWMIFIGFFCGSLTALMCSCMVLCGSRRTYYSDWYRGMYYRYGVDASGVTGGITGSAFGLTTSAVAPVSTIGPTTLGDTTGGTKRWTWRRRTYTYGTSGGSSTGESRGSTSHGTSRGTSRPSTSRGSSSKGSSAFDSYVVAV